MSVNTMDKTLRGPRGGLIPARQNESIAKRINSTIFPSTQGGPLMHVIAAKAVAHWIADVIEANGAEPALRRVRALVLELCRSYPVYAGHIKR